jgi:negative regulator of flagellin synthesis FlgM
MNIRNLPESSQAVGAKPKAKSSAPTPPSPSSVESSRADGVDKVALSQTSQQLQRTEPGNVPVDVRKVASLKAAVDQGSYQVNSDALADKLMTHQADLMRASKRNS